jgi:hypothetical protein
MQGDPRRHREGYRRSNMTAAATAIDLPTAESIADLFCEHDVLPWQTVYLALPGEIATRRGKCAACALGILLVEAHGDAYRARSYCRRSDFTVKEALRAEIDLPPAFLDGLDNGFTNSNDDPWDEFLEDHDRDDSLYNQGFRVGWQAWELANAGAVAEDHP